MKKKTLKYIATTILLIYSLGCSIPNPQSQSHNPVKNAQRISPQESYARAVPSIIIIPHTSHFHSTSPYRELPADNEKLIHRMREIQISFPLKNETLSLKNIFENHRIEYIDATDKADDGDSFDHFIMNTFNGGAPRKISLFDLMGMYIQLRSSLQNPQSDLHDYKYCFLVCFNRIVLIQSAFPYSSDRKENRFKDSTSPAKD